MNASKAGWLVTACQVLLLAGVGGKFLIDRAHYPHVWIATVPFDPNLPIRGRYLQMSAMVQVDPAPTGIAASAGERVRLTVRDDQLVAVPDENGHHWIHRATIRGSPCWVLIEPLAFFISEHAVDPSRRPNGEELWVEATIPPNGAPRPTRLGTKLNGNIVPLETD